MEIRNLIMEFISRNFSVETDEIDPQKSLVDEGVIDSTGFIEIIDFLESEFGIEIPEDQWSKENLGSILKIVKFVAHKVNSDGSEICSAM